MGTAIRVGVSNRGARRDTRGGSWGTLDRVCIHIASRKGCAPHVFLCIHFRLAARLWSVTHLRGHARCTPHAPTTPCGYRLSRCGTYASRDQGSQGLCHLWKQHCVLHASGAAPARHQPRGPDCNGGPPDGARIPSRSGASTRSDCGYRRSRAPCAGSRGPGGAYQGRGIHFDPLRSRVAQPMLRISTRGVGTFPDVWT